MSRWEPNARGRLEEAALELYAARGFDATTVAEIAERAGLTERTFFRHFADKREVLFSGQSALADAMVAAVAASPRELSPLEVVCGALHAAAGFIGVRRIHAQNRQAVIEANPGLQERELMKLRVLGGAVGAALRERGVPELPARLAAETGIAVFKIAVDRWVEGEDGPQLSEVIDEALGALRSLAAPDQ